MWCALCKEGYGPDSRFCGECGCILEDGMMPKREAGILRDPEQLAHELYDYWVESLKTDGYSEDVDEWDVLEGDIKRNFIEAVQEIVSKPVDRVVSDMEVTIAILEAAQAIDKMGEPKGGGAGGGGGKVVMSKHWCYNCARQPVDRAGGVCPACMNQARG